MAMNGRRKGVTYGKSTRRPMSMLSAITQENPGEPEAQHSGTMSSVSLKRPNDRPSSHVRTLVPQANIQRGRNTTASDSVYDIPWMADEVETQALAPERAKKRKQDATSTTVPTSSHHNALKHDKPSKPVSTVGRPIASSTQQTSRNSAGLPNQLLGKQDAGVGQKDRKIPKPLDRTHGQIQDPQKSKKSKHPKPTDLGSSDQVSSSLSKRVDDKKAQKRKTPPLQHPHTPTASPKRSRRQSPEKVDTSDSSGSGGLSSSERRRNKGVSAATTPKQAELWNKLLHKDTRYASPSLLEVSKLDLTTMTTDSDRDDMTSLQVGPEISTLRNIRSGHSPRLIDSLDPSGNFSDSLVENALEEIEAPSNDDTESIRSENPNPRASKFENGSARAQTSRASAPSQASSQSTGGPKVTYASQRSYLQDLGPTGSDLLGLPALEEADDLKEVDSQRLHGLIGSQPGPDLNMDLDDLPDSQNGTMRSIHELRQAGGNRRTAQELETWLEDLDAKNTSPLSAKRSSLLSLATKLLDASTCHLFIDQGLHVKLLNYLEISQDAMEQSLLLMLMLSILFSAKTKNLVMPNDPHFLVLQEFLTGFAKADQNITSATELRRLRVSKLMQREFETLCHSTLRSLAWRAGKPCFLSHQVIALQCLEYIVRSAREASSIGELLPVRSVDAIVESSLSLQNTSDTASSHAIVCCKLAVSILESETTDIAAGDRDISWSKQTHVRIRDLLPAVFAMPADLRIAELANLVLRLQLNLANTSSSLCDLYATKEVIQSLFNHVTFQFERVSRSDDDDPKSGKGDTLLLSLGCLINFADKSDSVRSSTLSFQSELPSLLEDLLNLFQQGRKKAPDASSEEQGQFVVAYGYLSVLLTYLCVDPDLKAWIGGRLQKDGSGLEQLLLSVEEFLCYHRQIDAAIRHGETATQRNDDFVIRSQKIVDDLRVAQ